MHSAVEAHSYFFSKRHRKFSHLKVEKMSQLSHTSLQAAGSLLAAVAYDGAAVVADGAAVGRGHAVPLAGVAAAEQGEG